MEEQQVEDIREASRNLLKLSRRYHRDEAYDIARETNIESISQESILDIANKLKNKAAISLYELQQLKNGLMYDPKHIELVLSTNGALKGLVREMTGNDVRKKCVAVECCCNLSLGDPKACKAVALAAGPYLILGLYSHTTEIIITSAWAIGNLAGSGPRASSLLVAQGAVAALCGLLAGREELHDGALYALHHLAYQLKDDLFKDDVTKILQSMPSTINLASAHLLFILSCHKDFIISKSLLTTLTDHLQSCIQTHIASCTENKCCELNCVLRTLANVTINQSVSELFVCNFVKLSDSLRMLLKDRGFRETLLWLLGNLYNYNTDNVYVNDLIKCIS